MVQTKTMNGSVSQLPRRPNQAGLDGLNDIFIVIINIMPMAYVLINPFISLPLPVKYHSVVYFHPEPHPA